MSRTSPLLQCLALFVLLVRVPFALAQSLPLSTSSRWILDASGARVKLRCINWAGHGETNIQEGLHKASIASIASFIADEGFNCVRLTYSIDAALNPTMSVEDSFSNAGVSELYSGVVENNAAIADATVLDVREAVVSALWDVGVMTVLDNHVSKAQWCCSTSDGNGWWDAASGYTASNSQYFNTANWLEGLSTMASWASTQEGVVGMSLRNELRAVSGQDGDSHADWYTYVSQDAQAVHDANADVLVIIGGVSYATDLSYIYDNVLDWSGWAGKHVWEVHAYEWSTSLTTCDELTAHWGSVAGYLLSQDQAYTAPLFMSEFGVAPGAGGVYWDCIREYMAGNDMEWALWALQGSYYLREGSVDVEETWGYIDVNWSSVRDGGFKAEVAELMEVTQGP